MNVLEIGYGSSHRCAVVEGGDIFTSPDVTYFGTTLPEDWDRVAPEHFDQVNPSESHWAALPFRDAAFGTVMMRSCFGQFTHSLDYAPSDMWSLKYGLHEVARVLEPDGILLVSEENTPADLEHVIPDIMRAGLDIDRFEFETTGRARKNNPGYYALRSRYYGREPGGIASGTFFNERYVVEARKPADRDFVTTTVNAKGMGLLRHRRTTRGKWEDVSEDEYPMQYLVPVDSRSLDEEMRIAQTMVKVGGSYWNYWVKDVEERMAEAQ